MNGGGAGGVKSESGNAPSELREDMVKGGMNEAAAAVWAKLREEAREAGRRVPPRITVYLLQRLEADGRREEAAVLAPFVTVGTRPQNRVEAQRARESEAANPGREFAAARYRYIGDKLAAQARREKRGTRARRTARPDGGRVELSVSVPPEVRQALEAMGRDVGLSPGNVAALILGTMAPLSGAAMLETLAAARRGNPERFLRAV